MATRNLSRTIIEGGRHWDSTVNRQVRNRKIRRMRFDAEGNLVSREPRLTVQCLYHHDRLAALRRWLRRNVGRPWSNVYSELCTLYDKRTVKGWHLRDHLRWEVEQHPRSYPYGHTWGPYVDARGMLRYREWSRGSNERAIQRRERSAAGSWAAGRRVIVRGSALFWTATIVDIPNHPPQASRQVTRLDAEDQDYWHGLSAETRSSLE